MKILVDMNLPPRWVQVFAKAGWKAAHWSKVGAPSANDRNIMTWLTLMWSPIAPLCYSSGPPSAYDRDIMAWARANGYKVIFTHDLDSSTLLASTQEEGPSVIQVQTQNILPEAIGRLFINVIRKYKSELEKGSMLTIEPHHDRVRVLPFKPT